MTRHKKTKRKGPVLTRLKTQLKEKGWTHQAAAEELGKSYEHFNQVLNGRRISVSLIQKIEALPAREVAAK